MMTGVYLGEFIDDQTEKWLPFICVSGAKSFVAAKPMLCIFEVFVTGLRPQIIDDRRTSETAVLRFH